MVKHIPVLLSEVIEMMALKPGMTVVDATLGGGGYGREIVRRIAPGGRYVGIDRDTRAIQQAEKEAWVLEGRNQGVEIRLLYGNFSELRDILDEAGIEIVDVVVADLGVSSDQLEDAQRGLSFLTDGPLDMRLDQSQGITAREIVNTWSGKEIERVLWENAEEKNARRIAQAIEKKRAERPIETTKEFVKIIQSAVGGRYRGKKIHPATKTFMALRMAVNKEKESLEKFLESAIVSVRSGGRIAVVTFHSGEDSIVKQFFREQAKGCICPMGFPVCRCGQVPKVKILTKRSVAPSEGEIRKNPRSRSARLRVVEKK